MSSIVSPGAKHIQYASKSKVKPGCRIAEPGGEKGQYHIHGKLSIKQITNGIAHSFRHTHKEKCCDSKNTSKEQNSKDSKIIKGIIKKCHGRQFFLGHIDGEIHKCGDKELKSGERP